MTLALPAVTEENLQFVLNLIAQAFPLSSALLANNAVATATLQDNSVTSAKLGVGTLRVVSVGTPKLNYGSGTLVFTAADQSAQLTVAHGLATTPALVLAMPKTPANARITVQETAAPDGTNVYLSGFQTGSVVITANQAFYWAALG